MRSCLVVLAACASAPHPSSPVASAASPSPACAAAEYRQLDFWIGDWDVTVNARASPTSDAWGKAKGHQRVEAILGGCAIAEHFHADGPQAPWNGASYSMWQPAVARWRQSWVDDSGGFLTFAGGPRDGTFVLEGEPHTVGDKEIAKRMVFHDIKPASLTWEWQVTDDHGAHWAPMMIVEYHRR